MVVSIMNMDKVKVTLGITTYNRKELLEKMIQSLYKSGIEGISYTIRVYDDCSAQYGVDELQSMFSEKVQIIRHEYNHGSDYNIGFMYRKFLETEDDVLFNCDADLIFSKNWLQKGLKLLWKTDGILSLFNTPNHTAERTEEDLCIKDIVGSAGTLMRREAVKMICDNIYEEDSYSALDINWCKFFRMKGNKIYVTRKSLVQHIGIQGFNSSGGLFDYGDGFTVDSLANGQMINDMVEQMSRTMPEKTSGKSFYYLFPFNKVKQGAKVIIYGAGNVGQDYLQQIRMTKYCEVVSVVDQAYMELAGVQSPEILRKTDCDYVILAAHFSPVRESMKKTVLEINDQIRDKIIDKVCYSLRTI